MSDRNRILIIEDDEGIRDGVRILFENEGYEVIEAGKKDGVTEIDQFWIYNGAREQYSTP